MCTVDTTCVCHHNCDLHRLWSPCSNVPTGVTRTLHAPCTDTDCAEPPRLPQDRQAHYADSDVVSVITVHNHRAPIMQAAN